MRLLVGFLGLALPLLLLAGDRWLLDDGEDWRARGSLSAYYHSGMRDVFVGILFVVGILLLTYKVSELNRDNLFSILAGIFAIGVAFFPTGIPDDVEASLTPLQQELSEGKTQVIHYVCAVAFIFFILLTCLDFGSREAKGSGPHKTFWSVFHRLMAGFIVAGVAFIGLSKWTGFFEGQAILIGETIVVVAFGLSWLAKSWNRDSLPKVTMASG